MKTLAQFLAAVKKANQVLKIQNC